MIHFTNTVRCIYFMEYKREIKKCLICDSLVKKWPTDSWRKYNEQRKYCSLNCRQIWNGGLTKEDPRVMLYVSKNSTMFKLGDNLKENNYQWKGDKASYTAKHMGIYRKYGKADKCALCGSDYFVQWANVSNTYQRDIRDWIKLCVTHHIRFDRYKSNNEKFNKHKNNYDSIMELVALNNS